jgi:hypothetical protein
MEENQNKPKVVKNLLTHITHCCEIHGCKYILPENEYCPVEARENMQEYPCEMCPDDEAEVMEAIKSLTEELALIRKLRELRNGLKN